MIVLIAPNTEHIQLLASRVDRVIENVLVIDDLRPQTTLTMHTQELFEAVLLEYDVMMETLYPILITTPINKTR